MAILDDITPFQNIEDTLLGNVSKMFDKSTDLIGHIAPIFSLAFGIYVLLQCWHYYNKGFDESFMDITKRMLGWVIIIIFAFNIQTYRSTCDTAYQLPNALSEVVSGKDYNASSMDNNWKNMNQKLTALDNLRSKLGMFDVGDKMVFGMLKIVIWLTIAFLLVVCFAFYLVAKISLVLVLMFGPLFIGFLLFPATRQWGVSWINQVFNYSLTAACYVVIGVMQNEFISGHLTNILNKMNNAEDVMAYLFMLIPILVFATFVFILVALNIPALVTGLVGGGTFNLQMRALGGIVGGVGAGATAMKNVGWGNRAVGTDGKVTGRRGFGQAAFDTGKWGVSKIGNLKNKLTGK